MLTLDRQNAALRDYLECSDQLAQLQRKGTAEKERVARLKALQELRRRVLRRLLQAKV